MISCHTTPEESMSQQTDEEGRGRWRWGRNDLVSSHYFVPLIIHRGVVPLYTSGIHEPVLAIKTFHYIWRQLDNFVVMLL
jgi:hypothetical protein